MTDLSTLSDTDLMAAYQQSLGGTASELPERASTPIGPNGQPIPRITVGAPDPSKMSDEELRAAYDSHQPSAGDAALGLAQAGGIGVAKGTIGLAGMAGDLQTLAGKAGEWLRSKVPSLPEPSEEDKRLAERYGGRGDLGPSFPLPTSEDIQGLVEKVTGPFRKPQNQAEADAQTVGEFLPAALAGPGGLARKVVTQAVVPATSSIIAGRYSDQNPYVKALAGFLGGATGALASGPSSVQQIIRSKIPASVTEQDITRAGQLIDHAQTRGVALTWPEALTRVTGQPILTDSQRVLESHGQTRAQMNEFFADRPVQIENAARAQFDQTGARNVMPSSLGPEAGGIAGGVINRVRGAINQATRPSYDAARQSLVPTQVHAAMMADPLFEQALNAVRNDPARNSFIRGLSDRSTVVYDAVKQELAERATNLSNPLQPGHSQTASAATGALGGDVRNIAVAADRHAMGLPPGQGTGNLEHALNEQARLRAEYLEPLQRGPLGKIADKDQTTQKAMNALFPENPLPNSEGEIRVAIRALVGQRPAVAEQLVRAHAEMTFNEAARALQGGANQFVGARFAKELAGNPQQRANLRAAIESLPNGADRWAGMEQLLDIAAATGARQPKGSLTAFNALEIPSMTTGGLQSLAAKGASPSKWMSFANDTFKDWSLGRNLDQLARIITDPRSGDALRQIVRIPPGSDRALVMAGRLIGQLGAATTEQRNQPRQANGN